MDMADTNVFDFEAQDKYKDLKDFADKNPNFDISGIDSQEKYEKALKAMEEELKKVQEGNGNEADENTPPANPENEQEGGVLGFTGSTSPENEPENQNNGWIEDNKAYWEKWCEGHQYQQPVVDDLKNGYAFDIYKSEADKKAGKKHGHIHYQSKTSVHVESDSYEVWKGVIDKAVKDGQGLSVSGMDPKTDAKAIKMVMIAATIAGAKDSLVGVPKDMEVTDKDLEDLGLTKQEQEKYRLMLAAGPQRPAGNENSEPAPAQESPFTKRVAQIREAKKQHEIISAKIDKNEDLSDEENAFMDKVKKSEEKRKPHLDNREKLKALSGISRDASKTPEEQAKAVADRNVVKKEMNTFANESMARARGERS